MGLAQDERGKIQLIPAQQLARLAMAVGKLSICRPKNSK
jgi:hypothetical protein